MLLLLSACADDDGRAPALDPGCNDLVNAAANHIGCELVVEDEWEALTPSVHCPHLDPRLFDSCPELCPEDSCVSVRGDAAVDPTFLAGHYYAIPIYPNEEGWGFDLNPMSADSLGYKPLPSFGGRQDFPARYISAGERFTIYIAMGTTVTDGGGSSLSSILCDMKMMTLFGKLAPCDEFRLQGQMIFFPGCTPAGYTSEEWVGLDVLRFEAVCTDG